MRNLKKFLALVLAFMMAMSLMITVNAATLDNVEFPDSESVIEAFQEDVIVMSGMGVIQGHADTGTFAPKAVVTRAQMAAIVYRLATGDAADARTSLYVHEGDFSDVKADAWYAGYVGYCANAGYIVGYPNGTFKPNDPVSGYAALAMILRAMGYNEPGHKFEGNNWKTLVASTATERGMLVKINQTIYANTLNEGAPRELVAEMAFQGATRAMVQWTNAFGYQITGIQTGTPGAGRQNQNLGYLYYGLTSLDGVIVGNEATGEGTGITEIGFSLTNGYIDDPAVIGTTGGSAYVTETDRGSSPENVTRTFKWNSDLRDFGHRVTVWFDDRSNDREYVGAGNTNYFTTNLNTYAVFDRAVQTKVVSGLTGTLDLDTAAAAGNIRKVAADNGFKLGDDTYWNYSFGPTKPAGYTNDPTSSYNTNFASPIKLNNSNDAYPLYLLISNNSNKTVDMVISLDLTVTQISQENKVVAPYSVGVTMANGGGTPYFDVEDKATAGANLTYANILESALVGGSTKTLGDKVVAIEVTGTTDDNLGGNVNNNATTPGNFANPTNGTQVGGNPALSSYYYQLSKLTRVVPGTVVKIDTNTEEVFLSNGTTLKKSVFADAVDGTFMSNDRVNAPRAYNTYNFTLDEEGNYIFWEPVANTAKFVYGTYMDYTTGLNTSVYTYSMVGVDKDGKMTVDSPITKYTIPDQSNPRLYNDLTSAANYNAIELPKRDATVGSGFVQEGQYIGYTIDENGILTAVTPKNGGNGGTLDQPFIQASGADFGTGATTIGARDVLIGAVNVGRDAGASASSLFITENTQIYIVSGAGTDTQKVVPYHGLSELMEGMDQVIIKNGTTNTSLVAGSIATTDPAGNAIQLQDMIYFTENDFTYAQDYTGSATQALTLFLPAEAVTFVPSVQNNLVFVGSNTSTLINAYGEQATQFTMYANGVGQSYWIEGLSDGTASTFANDADTIIDLGPNVFYRLVATNKKAMDGQPIYKILAVADTDPTKGADSLIIGQYYDGTTAVAITTNPGAGNTAKYSATTYNSQAGFISDAAHSEGTNGALYNVGSATVKNLNTRTYPGIVDTLATLNQAGSLTTNAGVPVSCVLSADSTAVVSVIYVNAP